MSSNKTLTCFKAYDIRGELGTQLTPDIVYNIGRAYGQYYQAKTVVVGRDIRLSSASLKDALAKGLMDAGTNVIDLGITGTEEVYFATDDLQADGGIEITASHNPMNYNGLKLVGKAATPISQNNGLLAIKELAQSQQFTHSTKGSITRVSNLSNYINHLISYIDTTAITPQKILVNAGNGAAVHVIDAIENKFNELHLPIEFIKIHHRYDGNFPNGIPNPLLVENRTDTINAIKQTKADFGIAWDGDFDRCFLFDEQANFIEGYYIVGLLASAFLQKNNQATIIYDPRLNWNTLDIIQQYQGKAYQSQTGHSFVKETMRKYQADYGGEMSAHHYFKDFMYCDSGMIPWLLVLELICKQQTSLSNLVKNMIAKFPASGEINQVIAKPDEAIAMVQQHYLKSANKVDTTDGISMEFNNWRFNLRKSNTEPLVRLNVESRQDNQLMQAKTEEILQLLQQFTTT